MTKEERATRDRVNSKNSEKAGIQIQNDMKIKAPNTFLEIEGRVLNSSNIRETQTNLFRY